MTANGRSVCQADGCNEPASAEVFWPRCPGVIFCAMHVSYAETLAQRNRVRITVLPIWSVMRKGDA